MCVYISCQFYSLLTEIYLSAAHLEFLCRMYKYEHFVLLCDSPCSPWQHKWPLQSYISFMAFVCCCYNRYNKKRYIETKQCKKALLKFM